MTTLSKDEVLRIAREAEFPQDWEFAMPLSALKRFATLCRADLVAEVERLKESMLAEQALSAMRKGMVDGLLERRRLDEDAVKAADGKGYVFP